MCFENLCIYILQLQPPLGSGPAFHHSSQTQPHFYTHVVNPRNRMRLDSERSVRSEMYRNKPGGQLRRPQSAKVKSSVKPQPHACQLSELRESSFRFDRNAQKRQGAGNRDKKVDFADFKRGSTGNLAAAKASPSWRDMKSDGAAAASTNVDLVKPQVAVSEKQKVNLEDLETKK